jgi:hypothetical protein
LRFLAAVGFQALRVSCTEVYWYCFLFRPRQGGSRPHISEGSDFSDFSSACRCAASRAAPNLKRADSILRSKMPFTWVGPPRLDPYQSSGLTLDSHARLQIVPYTAAIEVLS